MQSGKTSAITSFHCGVCCRELQCICYSHLHVSALLVTRCCQAAQTFVVVFFCGIFPFQYRCRGGFFLLLVVPPTPHFLLLHPMQMSSNMTALKITSGRSASCSDGTRAARRVHAFQLDETCWSFPGVSPHRLFLEMAHRTCCATISACCWALHFFPCMVMRLLRCLPFS